MFHRPWCRFVGCRGLSRENSSTGPSPPVVERFGYSSDLRSVTQGPSCLLSVKLWNEQRPSCGYWDIAANCRCYGNRRQDRANSPWSSKNMQRCHSSEQRSEEFGPFIAPISLTHTLWRPYRWKNRSEKGVGTLGSFGNILLPPTPCGFSTSKELIADSRKRAREVADGITGMSGGYQWLEIPTI